jgi:fluoride exporter
VTAVTAAVAFVVLAGGGTLVRAGAQGAARRSGLWPAGTLAVNLAGSLAVGLLAGAAGDDIRSPFTVAMVTAVAGLGALTTFSSFAHELAILMARQRWLMAGSYATTTLVAGVALAWVGLAITS